MRILIVDSLTESIVKECDHVPRVGDRVHVSYVPAPKVAQVLWWPSDKILQTYYSGIEKIDVILFLE